MIFLLLFHSRCFSSNRSNLKEAEEGVNRLPKHFGWEIPYEAELTFGHLHEPFKMRIILAQSIAIIVMAKVAHKHNLAQQESTNILFRFPYHLVFRQTKYISEYPHQSRSEPL